MSPLYIFFFTKIASTTGFVVVSLLIFLYLLLKHKARIASLFLLSSAGLMAAVQVLKESFRVPRLSNALVETVGYALPSGHAAGALFLALMLSYFASGLKKPARYAVYAGCFLLALSIGISRFQLGMHTPFQIIIGYLIGAFFAVVCIMAIRAK